jgi:hypothetical protein
MHHTVNREIHWKSKWNLPLPICQRRATTIGTRSTKSGRSNRRLAYSENVSDTREAALIWTIID